MSGDCEKSQNADLKAVSDVVRSVLALADEVRKRTHTVGPMYQKVAFFLFTKSHSTFKAICLLCENNFIQDAGILLRSLFEIVVNAYYIDQRPEERARLYREYDYVMEMQKKASDVTNQQKWQPNVAQEILKEYERVKDNYPDKWHWAGKSIRKMADEVGLSDHYETIYWVLSNLAHTTPRAAVSYLRETEQALVVGNIEGRYQLFRVLQASCIYFLDIIRINNSAFELGLEDKMNDVAREVSTLL